MLGLVGLLLGHLMAFVCFRGSLLVHPAKLFVAFSFVKTLLRGFYLRMAGTHLHEIV
jgi:hypothetical protein